MCRHNKIVPRSRGFPHLREDKRTPARNLFEHFLHLLLGQEEVLAFLHDLTIPFDNDWASYCTPFAW